LAQHPGKVRIAFGEAVGSLLDSTRGGIDQFIAGVVAVEVGTTLGNGLCVRLQGQQPVLASLVQLSQTGLAQGLGRGAERWRLVLQQAAHFFAEALLVAAGGEEDPQGGDPAITGQSHRDGLPGLFVGASESAGQRLTMIREALADGGGEETDATQRRVDGVEDIVDRGGGILTEDLAQTEGVEGAQQSHEGISWGTTAWLCW
jgi:hypothetical protein